MGSGRPHNTPSVVAAEDGIVIVDGHDGIVVSLTADAAIETSERLMDAGLRAKGQELGYDHEDPERAGRR